MTRDNSVDAQKRLSLDRLLAAWDSALGDGVEPEVLATTAIFIAITDMVDSHGAEAVATMLEDLPNRVRSGEFSLREDPSA
jgi:hypothetical protein